MKHRIRLGGRVIDYRLVRSKAARKLRVLVGPNGVEVVQPSTRDGEEAAEFLAANRTYFQCFRCGEKVYGPEAMRRIQAASPAFSKTRRVRKSA